MTTLIAWLGVDSRKPSSLYMASDSRISWGNEQKWDYARKIFASTNSPDILGYYGDVIFPSQVLGQVLELIENGLLFSDLDSAIVKRNKIFEIVRGSFC